MGAIDGTHIPIIKPDNNPSDCFNRKGFYSIIMQAVVDSRGLFLDAYIGWPGKVHDARVLVNSTLYKKERPFTKLDQAVRWCGDTSSNLRGSIIALAYETLSGK